MLIVGIHNTGINSSATIVKDGQLVFGCAEERLDRRKACKYFPHKAIEAGLAHVSASMSDVDMFAIAWNPAINIGHRYRAGLSEWPGTPGERLYSNPNHLLPLLGEQDFTETEQIFRRADSRDVRILHVGHHLAHAMAAYVLSGFDDAAVLVCDGYGERAATVWGEFRAGRFRKLKATNFPHSLGSFYSAITEHLGFRPDHDEWKVMGAAAYGDPSRFEEALGRLLLARAEGDYALDLTFFNHFDFDTPGMLAAAAQDLLGPPRMPGAAMEQIHFDLAAAAQKVTEGALLRALQWLRQETGLKQVCLSGGVFMNCLFNGKLVSQGPFPQTFIPYAPDDSGNSIGAALWAAWRNGETIFDRTQAVSPYLGTEYDDRAVAIALEKSGLRGERVDDPAACAAELLEQGLVIGWFQGRMEFGQRALGNRSILADPRDPRMKDRINAAVKFREGFRPFAPAVLESAAWRYFEMPKTGLAVPFMERALPIRPERRHEIPAVVHQDGTGRLQIVQRQLNPLFYDLITAFESRTGIPVVVNTSFNLNGEPIVESPTDAIRTFFSSGLDALIMGRTLLRKPHG